MHRGIIGLDILPPLSHHAVSLRLVIPDTEDDRRKGLKDVVNVPRGRYVG
jgi:hypothetical protein